MDKITQMVTDIGTKIADYIISDMGSDYEEEAEAFRSATTFGQLNDAIDEQNMAIEYLKPHLSEREYNLLG